MKKVFIFVLNFYGIFGCIFNSYATNTLDVQINDENIKILMKTDTKKIAIRKVKEDKFMFFVEGYENQKVNIPKEYFQKISALHMLSESYAIAKVQKEEKYRFVFINIENEKIPIVVPKQEFDEIGEMKGVFKEGEIAAVKTKEGDWTFAFFNVGNQKIPFVLFDKRFKNMRNICFLPEKKGITCVKRKDIWKFVYLNFENEEIIFTDKAFEHIEKIHFSLGKQAMTCLIDEKNWKFAFINFENTIVTNLEIQIKGDIKLSQGFYKIDKTMNIFENYGIAQVSIGKNEKKLAFIDLNDKINPLTLSTESFQLIKFIKHIDKENTTAQVITQQGKSIYILINLINKSYIEYQIDNLQKL